MRQNHERGPRRESFDCPPSGSLAASPDWRRPRDVGRSGGTKRISVALSQGGLAKPLARSLQAIVPLFLRTPSLWFLCAVCPALSVVVAIENHGPVDAPPSHRDRQAPRARREGGECDRDPGRDSGHAEPARREAQRPAREEHPDRDAGRHLQEGAEGDAWSALRRVANPALGFTGILHRTSALRVAISVDGSRRRRGCDVDIPWY